MFDKFYAAYPRKIARLDAEKAWMQMTRRYPPETIVSAAERFARSCAEEGTEKHFIPYPASWLRSGRFLDEEPETIKAAPVVRSARSLEELKAFLNSVGRPVHAEIQRARTVEELPTFMRMIPTDWKPTLALVNRVSR